MERTLIYENPLASEADVKDFVMEGSASVYFENGKMRMKNNLSADMGQKSNFVFWCPVDFPSDVEIEWRFRPIEEPGLCILFFSAKGINGEDLFDPSLAPRDGQYNLYHSGDINAYHVSYFRRKWDEERSFHTCNLRKSKGFHLVTQGRGSDTGLRGCEGILRAEAQKIQGAYRVFGRWTYCVLVAG